MMLSPVCPFCAKEVDPMHEDGIAFCSYCKEMVQAEEEAVVCGDPEDWEAIGDPDLEAEVAADFLTEELQDKFESDSRNFGFDDEYLERSDA